MTEKIIPNEAADPDQLPPCGILRRVASMAYDSLLIIALLMVASAIVVIPTGNEIQPGTFWFQIYLVTTWWGYFAVCWRMGGQTVGMRAWRVRLITERGNRIGWSNTALRFLVAGISAALVGLGFLWSLVEPRGRTWHDMATATRLVVTPRKKK